MKHETGASNEVVMTDKPSEMPVAKKQRAPRRSKADIESALAAAAIATTAKSPKVRKKRAAQAKAASVSLETPAPATTTKKTQIKGARKTEPVSQLEVPAIAPVTASDEIADLIQLEEENKRLRAALAEKLRAENADPRKRLAV
ncbi:SyrB-like regulator [Rhizobium ruizarguesonis]